MRIFLAKNDNVQSLMAMNAALFVPAMTFNYVLVIVLDKWL